MAHEELRRDIAAMAVAMNKAAADYIRLRATYADPPVRASFVEAIASEVERGAHMSPETHALLAVMAAQ